MRDVATVVAVLTVALLLFIGAVVLLPSGPSRRDCVSSAGLPSPGSSPSRIYDCTDELHS
ncbi:MAG TPA: hypothetical protein VGK63_04755 [Candidatus Limnocylindrales bacterium]